MTYPDNSQPGQSAIKVNMQFLTSRPSDPAPAGGPVAPRDGPKERQWGLLFATALDSPRPGATPEFTVPPGLATALARRKLQLSPLQFRVLPPPHL